MLDLVDVDEHPGIFIDRMNIVLNRLNNRESFELIKPNIDKIIFQAIIIAKVSDKIDNLEITSSSKQVRTHIVKMSFYDLSILMFKCLSNILKVLKAIQNFKKIDVGEIDNVFLYDYLSSSLSILERRVNTTILNLISKV